MVFRVVGKKGRGPDSIGFLFTLGTYVCMGGTTFFIWRLV